MIQRLLALARVALGLVFVIAATLKLGDIATFAEEVANYRMLPATLVPYFVCALLGVALIAGAALVIGTKSRAPALLLSVLLAGFTAAVALLIISRRY